MMSSSISMFESRRNRYKAVTAKPIKEGDTSAVERIKDPPPEPEVPLPAALPVQTSPDAEPKPQKAKVVKTAFADKKLSAVQE